MNDKTKKYAGVAGDPISHSLSPKLHGYWLQQYGIDGEYAPYHVTAEELPEFIAGLKENNISGLNLTVPHKEQAFDLVERVDPVAKKIGAINTVYFDEDGGLVGTNTDGYGFLKHLKQSASWSSEKKSAVILGAGGAARAVLVSLLEDGIGKIRLTNRTASRAEDLASELSDTRVKVIPWGSRDAALEGADLLVNVTTLGMTGQRSLELSLDNLPTRAVVYDIVYNPLETELLKEAAARGNKTVDGLGMLLHQAVPGFEKWFGRKPEVDDGLRDHLFRALS